MKSGLLLHIFLSSAVFALLHWCYFPQLRNVMKSGLLLHLFPSPAIFALMHWCYFPQLQNVMKFCLLVHIFTITRYFLPCCMMLFPTTAKCNEVRFIGSYLPSHPLFFALMHGCYSPTVKCKKSGLLLHIFLSPAVFALLHGCYSPIVKCNEVRFIGSYLPITRCFYPDAWVLFPNCKM